MNYQEWQHSAFYDEGRSCQSCHMPRAAGPIRVVVGARRRARRPVASRVRRRQRVHAAVLNRFRDAARRRGAAGRARSDGAADRAAAAGRTRPRWRSRRRSLPTARSTFDVDVRNLTGHKFPTGYPARRAWLHVTVRDDDGPAAVRVRRHHRRRRDRRATTTTRIRARSSRTTIDHRSAGPGRRSTSRSSATPTRSPTTGLLSAVQYLKDNRLLPRGFDKATADPQIGVFGAAAPTTPSPAAATGFATGSAARRDAASGAIEVELRYQPIGYRWAHNLERVHVSRRHRRFSASSARWNRAHRPSSRRPRAVTERRAINDVAVGERVQDERNIARVGHRRGSCVDELVTLASDFWPIFVTTVGWRVAWRARFQLLPRQLSPQFCNVTCQRAIVRTQ